MMTITNSDLELRVLVLLLQQQSRPVTATALANKLGNPATHEVYAVLEQMQRDHIVESFPTEGVEEWPRWRVLGVKPSGYGYQQGLKFAQRLAESVLDWYQQHQDDVEFINDFPQDTFPVEPEFVGIARAILAKIEKEEN